MKMCGKNDEVVPRLQISVYVLFFRSFGTNKTRGGMQCKD